MQLVDQPRLQILPDRRNAAAESDVAAARRGARLFERGLNAVGDEAKLRAALHLERRARVMREDEHRRVIRRLLAPPAAPAIVGPRPAHRPEHVAPEDPRADVGEALLRHGVVGPRLAFAQVLHLAPEARGEEPLHQLGTAHAERVLQVLVRPGAVAVDGDGEALHAQLGHPVLS